MRLIDADALIAQYKGDVLTAQVDYAEGVRDVIEDIKNAPSIDIVRCAECEYSDIYDDEMFCRLRTDDVKADDFCSYGERKESE